MKGKKRFINILFVLFVFLISLDKVKAITVPTENIPYNSYVIGTHLFTDDDNEIYNTENNENTIYNTDDGLLTPSIMLGASSIGTSNYNDMIIYYYYDTWTNALSGKMLEVSESFEITHVNGICIDSSCMGNQFSITFEAQTYETGVFQSKTVYLNYGEKIADAQIPVLNKRPGYRFVCWTIKGIDPQEDDSDCFNFDISITDDGVIIPEGERELVLEIKWEQINYKITYDSNFATGTSILDEDLCYFYDDDNENNCKFKNYETTGLELYENYRFLGWALDPNGKEIYQPETEMKAILEDKEEITLYAIWSADEYRIRYDLDGGTFNPDDEIVNSFNAATESIELFNPSKLGYTFGGWRLNGKPFDGTDLPKGDDIILKAKWNPHTYTFTYGNQVKTCTYDERCDFKFTVTERPGQKFLGLFIEEDGSKLPDFVFNYTTVNGANFIVYDDYETIGYEILYDYKGGNASNNPSSYEFDMNDDNEIEINPPERTGYTFTGWDVVGDATIDEDNILVINNASNIKLTANWTKNRFTFTYNDNGEKKVTTCLYDEPCTLTFVDPELSGQQFKYWYYLDGETKVKIEKNVTNYTSQNNKNYDVYPEFGEITYTITYDYVGGTVSTPNDTSYTVTTSTITLHIPEKTGYKFTGWTKSDNVNISSGNKTLTILNVGNITLKANWTPITYKFIYDDEDIDVEPITCTYDDDCSITFTPKTVSGLVFKNWYYLDDSNNEIKVDYNVKNYTTEDEKVYRIKPKYGNVTYFINYDYMGGVLDTSNKSEYTVDDKTITLDRPSKEGYSFSKWVVVEGPATVLGDTLTINGVGNIKVSVEWGPISYKFVYGEQEKACAYNSKCLLDFTHEEIEGKKFAGFYVMVDGKKVMLPEFVTNFTTVHDTSYEVKDIYDDIEYDIIYNLNGGTGESRTKFKYDGTKENILTIQEPIRTGYTFAGWVPVESANVEVISNTSIKVTSADSVKLKATWNAITYILKYKEGKLETCTYDEECAINFEADPVDGKVFKYWYVDGTPIKVVPEYVTNFTTVGGEIQILPHYEDIKYNITYEYNGGIVSIENKKEYTLSDNTFTLNLPSKKGYVFDGWDKEGNVSIGGDNRTVTLNSTGDVVLKAKWTPIHYYFKYNDKVVDCTYDTKCEINFVADSIVGKEFKNWYTGEGADKKIVPSYVTNFTDTEKTIDINAEYSLVKYSVSYDYTDGNVAVNNLELVTYDIDKVTEDTNENVYSLNLPSKKGYVFDGWDIEGNASVSEDYRTLTINGSENIKLTAKWNERKITITYIVDGEETVSPKCDYTSCRIKDEKPSKNKFDFDGWIDENGVVYQSGSELNIGEADEIRLIAKWTNSYRYTINYNLNNGEYVGEGEISKTYLAGESIVVPSLSKEGYIFNGWKLDNVLQTKDETGKTIITDKTEDIDLVADWTPIHYYFKYNDTVIDCTYGVECPIEINADVDGKTLIGFYDNNKQLPSVVKNYTAENGKIIDIEARYSVTSYNVTYDYAGGKVSENNKTTYNVDSNVLNLNVPTKVGYTFVEWILPEGRGTVEGNKITITGALDVLVTASWEKNKVTFEYLDQEPIVCEYDVSCTNTFTQVDENGKTPTGLYVKVDGKDVLLPSDLTNFSTLNTTYEVFAKYDLVTYNISYDYAGGDEVVNPTSYDITHNVVELNEPRRTGYKFKGWIIDASKATVDSDNKNIYTITATDAEGVTFTADWEIINYNVIFHYAGKEESVACTYGVECEFGVHKIDDNTRLLGWALEEDGSLFYGDNLKVRNLSTDGTDVHLYAVTEDITPKYSIYYNTLGGVLDTADLETEVLSGTDVTLPTLENKEGYEFKGWINAKTGEVFTESITITENTILVANWELVVDPEPTVPEEGVEDPIDPEDDTEETV